MSASTTGSAPLALRSCSCLLLGAAFIPAAWADFEEVRILRADPVHFQSCPPPGYAPQAGVPPPPPPPGPQPLIGGLTGKEIAGGAAGAAVGGLLGNQVGRGSGKTAATVAGAGIGAYAGYKLAEEKPQAPPPPGQVGQPGQPMQAGAPMQPGMPMQPGAPMQTTQIPPACTFITHYRISYTRPNGMPGEVMMTSQPTGGALMINFCGDRPCQ